MNHFLFNPTHAAKMLSALIVVCFTLKLYQFAQNLEDILTEWQTAWNLTRRRVTRRLVWFQAVCKGPTNANSRRRAYTV